jgi:hypothetical protein
MRKPDPVEIVLITVPLLCEALAVALFITAGWLWLVIASTS